ncbi:hypothetical protein CT0861_02281 [Colletotrichum tofieldiae]|uniref:Uncharacterized protein n=1 Tax=Colletotrichum tofieldiae TaxID=708197 RepID=A0A161WLG6_9PEZI|nr:hypothetical protein CT0861_02281 [Colletotrichum tofieldiae]
MKLLFSSYSYRFPVVYLSPVSHATVTTTFPGPSSFARARAATTLSPVEVPAKIPSSFASLRHISRASSSGYARTSSYNVLSSKGGTNPGPIPSMPLENLRGAHNHTSAPGSTTKRVDPPRKLYDELLPELFVAQDAVFIVELVCSVVILVLIYNRLGPFHDGSKQIRCDLAGGAVDVLYHGAECSHSPQLLFRKRIRADCDEFVTLEAAYEGES